MVEDVVPGHGAAVALAQHALIARARAPDLVLPQFALSVHEHMLRLDMAIGVVKVVVAPALDLAVAVGQAGLVPLSPG